MLKRLKALITDRRPVEVPDVKDKTLDEYIAALRLDAYLNAILEDTQQAEEDSANWLVEDEELGR